MAVLATPKVQLQLVPVPKPVLYAGIAGELLKNTGMKDNAQIQAIQQAVSEGLIETVIVLATHSDGRIEKFTLSLKPFSASDTVSLNLENGKSYLEALDVGLAGAVQYAANLISRQGLTPNFRVEWSARAKASPNLIADALRRLNLKVEADRPTPPPPLPPAFTETSTPPPPSPMERYLQTVRTYTGPPPLPPGFNLRPVLTVTPQKDPNVSFTYVTSRKAGP